MATPRINRWVTIEHIGLATLVGAETIFNFQSDTADLSVADMANLNNTFQTAMKTLIQNCQSTQTQLLRTVAKSHNATFPNVDNEMDYPVNTFGTSNFDPLPNNAAMCVKLITGRTGRSYRGRQYMFGMSEVQQQGNYGTSGYISAVTTLFNRYLLGFVSGTRTYIPACPSRSLLVLNPYIAFSIDARIDTQRRRLPQVSDFGV